MNESPLKGDISVNKVLVAFVTNFIIGDKWIEAPESAKFLIDSLEFFLLFIDFFSCIFFLHKKVFFRICSLSGSRNLNVSSFR